MKHIIIGVLFILATSIAAHLIFSSIGFSGTDDGYMLAYSRRILDGQLPYRDFISPYNIGTPLLWTPFVLFGGDYVFWITRYVFWFEFAAISWIWTALFVKQFARKVPIYEQIIIALIAFCFCTYAFQPMPWYTVDGIFFFTIGYALGRMQNKTAKTIGYLLVGFTFVTKQNFIFLLPATIFLLGDWKSKRYWAAMFFPSLVFYLFFLCTGAIKDVILQTTSRTEFFDTAIQGFLSRFTMPWGVIFGFSGLYLLKRNKNIMYIFFGSILFLIPVFYSAHYLSTIFKFIYDSSYFLFGTVTGIALFYYREYKFSKDVRLLLAGMLIAWCAGISGYNTPALASGILFIIIWIVLTTQLNSGKFSQKAVNIVRSSVLLLLLLLTLKNFYFTRTHNLYDEPRPADEITYDASSVFPGGEGIRVSKEMYVRLSDMQKNIQWVQNQHMRYAILQNYPALWVKSAQRNPFLMDAPYIYYEQKNVTARFIDDIKRKRGQVIIIIDKRDLQPKNAPANYNDIYPSAIIASNYYNKIRETAYFALYK